jgi:hypothetical protein
MSSEAVQRLARTVPANSVPWFDRLNQLGLIERWMSSESLEEVRYAAWLLGAPSVWKARSVQITQLLRAGLNRGGAVREELLRVFQRERIHYSREIFDLFLQLLHEGAFDAANYHAWNHLYDIGEKSPSYAAELVANFIDRIVELSPASEKRSPLDEEPLLEHLHLPENVIDDAVRRDPAAFVKHVLPRVVALITKYAVRTEDGRVLDRVWAFRSFGFRHDFKAYILEGLSDAMEKLAANNAVLFEQLTANLDRLPHQNIASLLLAAWAANPRHFGDRAVIYMLTDPHRLSLGYSMWDSGNGTAAVSRAAIRSVTEHCSENLLRSLEGAILNFYPAVEKERPKSFGYTQFLLLNALQPERRSEQVLRRLQELERKFPKVDLRLPIARVSDNGVVHSPIPGTAAKKMTDEQWISAMKRYGDTEVQEFSEDFLKGGALELSSHLEGEAKRDRSRFAQLLLRMGADVPQVHAEAILRGILAPKDQQPKDSEYKPLSTSVAVQVVRHVYQLFGIAAGRWVAHAISRIADRDVPNEIFKIVSEIAQDSSDPDQELWQVSTSSGHPYYGGDPLTHGLNSARGEAAHAIAALLFADKTRFDRLQVAVKSVVKDRSIAVRAIAIECLLAMLNFDPDKAVEWFLDAARGIDPLLGTMFADRFLYYTVFTHYAQLRAVLLEMLDSADNDVREIASQKIALASFRFEDAQTDVRVVLEKDEVCRAAVAYIDTANLRRDDCAELSRARLKQFFFDDSKKVKGQASRCFRKLSDNQLSREADLINTFIESPAFESNANSLLMRLQDSVARLPDVICRIPERAVALHQVSGKNELTEARWWTSQMATLVLRLYEQTSDPNIKRRCLDAIDSMIELDFGGISTELAKLEP